jgi:hypothetical protein
MTIVEIVSGDLFPSRPSGEGFSDRSLLAKRAFGVTGGAKMFEEWLDVVVEQTAG